MDFLQYRTGCNDEGRRLDRVLKKFLPHISTALICKYLRKNLIKINGKKSNPDYKITSDDVISIADFIVNDNVHENKDVAEAKCVGVKPKQAVFPSIKINDIFKNQYLRIINKPYDIAVQKSSADSLALDAIIQKEYRENSSDTSLSFKPGPLHRLDKKTTGILVFSENLEGAKTFSELMQSHSVKKEYLAVVTGKFAGPQVQHWEDYISASGKQTKNSFHTVAVSEIASDSAAKKAVTTAECLATGEFCGKEISLVRFFIETGRTHQIRSQSAFHGYPLFCDIAYGGFMPHKTTAADPTVHMFLHSYRMYFPKDNTLGLPPVLEAPLPDVLLSFIKKYLSEHVLHPYNISVL